MHISGKRSIDWSCFCKLRPYMHLRLWAVCLVLAWLPATAHAAPPTGYLDLISANRIAGWAFDPDYPGSIGLQVYVDGVFLRNITANRKRADLTFWNNTRIAFDDPILINCGTHLVTINMVGMSASGPDGQYVQLSSQNVTRSCGAGQNPYGYVDVLSRYWIAGWARDPDNDGPVQVQIYIDGMLYTTLLANSYRSDVGAHAFDYRIGDPSNPIPHGGLPLGSGNHRVDVYAVGIDANGAPDQGTASLGNSTATLAGDAGEFLFTSFDNQVRIIANTKFGGAITKIHDFTQPNVNLLDGDQAGAMFQSAFWVLPVRSGSVCGFSSADWLMDNPTQAGFYADGWQGNPIGQFGTSGVVDPEETVSVEDDGLTLHFKSRYIRYNYCAASGATWANRSLWDTDFYLEQWISMQQEHPRTLRIRSRITYEGPGSYVSSNGNMTSRQLPVIFGAGLPNVAWEENQAGSSCSNNWAVVQASTSMRWVASTQGSPASGIGMVLKPTTVSSSGALFYCQGSGGISALYPNLPALETLGTVSGVTANDVNYQFASGGWIDWTTYHPIGNLTDIRSAALALLSNWPSQ
jgi:hypothetical protein